MDWLAKLKEKAEERTISVLFALIVLLSLIVWGAVPSEVWDRVSEVTPKRALWALAGLQLIAAILACAYIYNLRKQRKQIQAENVRLQDLIDNPPKVFRFGAWWDKQGIPYCPVEKDIPLGEASSAEHAQTTFYCHKHRHYILPTDDEGKRLTPTEARRRFAPALTGEQSAPALPPKPEPELDEDCERLLRIIANRNYEHDETTLSQLMSVHPERCNHYLEILEDGEYIYAIRTMMPGSETTYHIGRRGREYAMKRRWF